jgi:hypothetical protein
MSPPSPPAGPVPIPYPNTAMASDTADGTKTVKIGGKEAGMKNSSTYSKSTGDEPATQSFGANVGSHKIQGAMKFSAWSSDVKLEGANAIRMGDMTTHNHSNPQGVSALTASVAGVSVGQEGNCEELEKRNEEARAKMSSADTKGVQKVGAGPTTITHGTYTTGSQSFGLKACSRSLVETFDGGFVKGKKFGQKGGKTIVCGKEFEYPAAGIPKCAHTEARILDTLMEVDKLTQGSPGGTLLMAINWQSKKGPSSDPCPDCNRMICAAAECLKIQLCKEGEPTEPDCGPKKA